MPPESKLIAQYIECLHTHNRDPNDPQVISLKEALLAASRKPDVLKDDLDMVEQGAQRETRVSMEPWAQAAVID